MSVRSTRFRPTVLVGAFTLKERDLYVASVTTPDRSRFLRSKSVPRSNGFKGMALCLILELLGYFNLLALPCVCSLSRCGYCGLSPAVNISAVVLNFPAVNSWLRENLHVCSVDVKMSRAFAGFFFFLTGFLTVSASRTTSPFHWRNLGLIFVCLNPHSFVRWENSALLHCGTLWDRTCSCIECLAKIDLSPLMTSIDFVIWLLLQHTLQSNQVNQEICGFVFPRRIEARLLR